MNDREHTRLHENLTTQLDTDERTRFFRSGLNQEEGLILTFFHLFYDSTDPTTWIDRLRTCLNAPTPRHTVGSNAELWNKLYAGCAKIGIDWPGKEAFFRKAGERFQREFDDAMRTRYSRENEEIAKLHAKLDKAQSRIDELEIELTNTKSRHIDGAELFQKRILMYGEQFASCERQHVEFSSEFESTCTRMANLGSQIHSAKQETPQFRQTLQDARAEYNIVFDALESATDDMEKLNEAHTCVVKAAQALHDHLAVVENLEQAYIEEGNNMKATERKLETLPHQQEYLGRAVRALDIACKLFGFNGEVDLEALFLIEPSASTELDGEILDAELRGLLQVMDLLQLIGPRNIKAARNVVKTFSCETTEDFVAAIVYSDLESRIRESVATRRRGVNQKLLETFLDITLPNLKKRWQTDGAYDRKKIKEYILQKSNYNAVFGRTAREPNRESA